MEMRANAQPTRRYKVNASCRCSVMTRLVPPIWPLIIPLAILAYTYFGGGHAPTQDGTMSRALTSRVLSDLHTYWYQSCPAQSPIPKSVMMGWFVSSPEVDNHCRCVSGFGGAGAWHGETCAVVLIMAQRQDGVPARTARRRGYVGGRDPQSRHVQR